MKKLFVITAAAVLASCGGGMQVELSGDVAELKSQKDSLSAKIDEINAQIAAIDEQLALLDTTIEERVMLVSTVTLAPRHFEHYFEVQGLVEAEKSVTLSAEIAGKIKRIYVSEGQDVRKGQKLMAFDVDMIESSIAATNSQYELAKAVFEKQKRLWEQQIGSEVQYLQAKTNAESLEQQLKTMQEQRDMAIVQAPSSGTIDEIFPKEGEMGAPGFPLVRIVNGENAYIVAEVSEKYITQIKRKNPAMINFGLINDDWYPAQVSKVGQYINPANRSFKVNIDIIQSDVRLRPNLLSSIRIKDFGQDSALAVPSKAIMQDAAGQDYVFVANADNMAKKVVIETGMSYEGQTHVVGGLNPGDAVIIEGARSIRDGEKVDAVKNEIQGEQVAAKN